MRQHTKRKAAVEVTSASTKKLQNNGKSGWRRWSGRNPLTFAWFAMLTKHPNNCKFRTGPLEKLEKRQAISFEAASEPAARKLSLMMPKRWQRRQEMLRKKLEQQTEEMWELSPKFCSELDPGATPQAQRNEYRKSVKLRRVIDVQPEKLETSKMHLAKKSCEHVQWLFIWRAQRVHRIL